MSPDASPFTSPLRPTGRRAAAATLRLALLLALVCSGAGCAGGPALSSFFDFDAASFSGWAATVAQRPEPRGQLVLVPRGPGAVFSSVDEAALDALSYSFLASRRSLMFERDARGGGIHPVEGGFSYDEPTASSEGISDLLRYRLRADDVAHFRHDPHPWAARGRGSRRGLSRRDRRFVDHTDPVHRPLYLLTAERYLRRYPGAEVGEQTLARVRAGTRRGDDSLVLTAYAELPGAVAVPLALQPTSR